MQLLFQLKWEELINNQKVREEVEKVQNIPAAPPPPTISEQRLKENGCGKNTSQNQEDKVLEETVKMEEDQVMEEMARLSMRCPSPVPSLAEINGGQKREGEEEVDSKKVAK